MTSNTLMTAQPFVEKIDHHEIKKICVVGKGSFGTVYKAMWKNQYVAVKYIEAEQNEFIKEVDQLSRISHRNIVGLYGACTQKPNVFLVMEFAEGGSLYDLLHCNPLIKYNDGHAMRWMKQCAEAVAYLHAKTPRPLIHRDLKSLNLLLVKDGTILKICDFGTATDKKTFMSKDKGTVAYMAPEVFIGELKYTEKCDIYSWSIIVWEVLSRKKPFEQYDNEHAIMYDVGKGNRPLLQTTYYIHFSEKIKNLITTCWNQDPDNRPAMIDVVKQMKDLCKHFPDIGVPLVIPEPGEDNSRNGVVRNTLLFIEHHEINVIKIIGKGSFGTVHKAEWRNEYVAVKYIELDLNEFTKEVEQLFQEKHPNIVRMYGVYTQEQYVCLVMELAESSLANVLHCSPRIQYTTGHAMSWAKQCAEGVAFLHAMKPRPLIHRNLRSMSLLVMKGGTVIKISGFGTTTKQSTFISMGNETLLYMAPEVSQGLQYTEKSDVYSWGIILWEVFSRQKPFEKFYNQFSIMDMVQTSNHPQLINEWPEPIRNLMTICWDQKAANRPTMSDIVKKVPDLCKSFPGGDIPLAIQDLFVENIDHHEINKFNLVGQGTFGKVYKAMWKNQFVAVKYIEEIGPLHRILHPNIVRLYGVCIQKPNACILMEFCENSSLKCLLDRKPVIQFTIGHEISWMKQCAEALEFLHSMIPRPLIYRSLSLMKLLLVDNGTVLKLCEVRTAAEQNTPLTNCEWITHYTAPEVTEGKTYTEKADVFSWGMILLEVFSNETYEAIDNILAIINGDEKGNCPLLEIHKYPAGILDFFCSCLHDIAENRPTMSNIVKQMTEFSKSFPGGNIPLAIRNQLVEEIDHREINKFSLVGKGTFGTVYKAVWKNQDVAVKYTEKILAVAQISHPNIVHLYGMCPQEPNVCLVMEFCDGISLYNVLFSKPQIQYTDEHAIFWMKQCAEAFAYLHSIKSRPLMHWNFKTQNLLLVNDGTVLKICDICKTTKENKLFTIDRENRPYTAPEVIQECEYTEKCDTYSWGFLLLVLLNRPSSVDLIQEFDYGRETLKTHTKPIENIIRTCCDRDPANRPTMFDVAKEMIDICKSHPGGDIPLVIPVPSAEENSLVGNDAFGTIYNAAWNDQYIAGHCINEKLNPLLIEFRSLTWISYPNKVRQISSVPIIDRTSYKPESFEEFIHFLIADDCNITDDNGIELLKLAIKFKVVKLENKVINSNCTSVTWSLKLFEFGVVEKYQFVRKFFNDLIAWNYGACLINPYFLSLHPGAVNMFLDCDQIKKNTGYSVTEVDIFNALVRWIDSYCTAHRISRLEGRELFDSLLKKIRFQTMSTEEFNKCVEMFPGQLNVNEGLIESRKDFPDFVLVWRKITYGQIFGTTLIALSDVILRGLRVGIEQSRKPFQIKIIKKCFNTLETEVVVIEQNANIYYACATISLGDSLVLKPQFEYKIYIEYSKETYKNLGIACRPEGVSVAVDPEHKNTVWILSSSDNMFEMMFANTEI